MARRISRAALAGTAILLIDTLAMAPAVMAQQQAPAAEEAEPVIEDIVVTARRREERLQDVPVAVTALSARALDRAAVSDIVSIAQLVPSMVVGRQVTGSSASIFLRGVGSGSLSSGFDQSVSTVLDNIPMSRGKEIVFSQFDLQQVEVLKGPQALFFGRNSSGGLINIRTADPTDSFKASMKAGYEFNADEVYGEGFVSGPITDTLKARIAIRASDMKGPFKNSGATTTDSFGFTRDRVAARRGGNNSIAGRLSLAWEPTDAMNWSFKLGGTHYQDNGPSDLYERLCGAGRATPLVTGGLVPIFSDCKLNGRQEKLTIPAQIAAGTPLLTEKPFTDSKSYYSSLNGNYDLGKAAITSVTGYYYYRQRDVNDMFGGPADSFVGQYAKFRQFSQELRLSSQFEGPLNITTGVFYSHGKFDYNLVSVNPPFPAGVGATGRYDSFEHPAGIKSDSISAFAELRYNLMENLEFSGGARWSQDKKDSFVAQIGQSPVYAATYPLKRFDDKFKDTNVSPQATLTWKPTPDVTLYGAYKQGYKSGGFNTSVVILAATKPADAQFNSETAKGGEIGFRGRLFDRQLDLNITAYRYTYSGLQVQIYDPVTTAGQVKNAGALRTTGVEADFIWAVPNAGGFEIHGSAAYNRAIFHDYVGTCYTGQTVAGGCDQLLNAAGTAFTSQDYEGRTAPKAPRFAARLGFSYPTEIGNGRKLVFSSDAQYSSHYNFSDALRPDAVQGRFVKLDAGVRLIDDDAQWELALFGRNLTNKYTVTTGNDMSGGLGVGGTGTGAGQVADINAVVDRPRQIYLQVTKRF